MNRSRQRRLSDRGRDDRGVVLVLAALLLVTLLVFSAFAVDVGAVYSERRQDQTAADAAALAAASPQVAGDTQTMLDEVLLRLNGNLDANFVLADLNTCDDDLGRLPVVATISGSQYNCVSFSADRTEIRVHVPPRDYSTAFAHLIGVDVIDHSAFAIAGTARGAFGGILPFGLSAGAGTGHICIKVGAQEADLCDRNVTGKFGFLNFGHHGNASLGTPVQCNGQGDGRIPANIAMGVDHLLSLYGQDPHGNIAQVDTGSPCGSIAAPNAADPNSGNTPRLVGEGLMWGTNFYDNGPARLQRQSATPPAYFQWASVSGNTLDDNPLWEFIEPTLSFADDVPTSCYRSVFVGPTGGLGDMSGLPTGLANYLATRSVDDRMRLLLSRCIFHYETGTWSHPGYAGDSATGCAAYPCTDPVFSRTSSTDGVYDIQQTPRFGYVPVTVEDPWPPSGAVRFARFRAIFIQRLCIGNVSCSAFDPGVGASVGGSDDRIGWFTAFAFPDAMLPNGLGEASAPLSPANAPVRLLR